MGKIDEEGYYSLFDRHQCKLTCGSLIMAKGKICCSLYQMEAKVCDGEANTSEDQSLLELWHKRFGHVSKKSLLPHKREAFT